MAWSKKRTVLWGCGGYGLVSFHQEKRKINELRINV